MSNLEGPLSPDGRHRWNGAAWVPVEPSAGYPPPPIPGMVAGVPPMKPKQPVWLWIVLACVGGLVVLCGLGGLVAMVGDVEDEPATASSDASSSADPPSSDTEDANRQEEKPATIEPSPSEEPDPPPPLTEMPDTSAANLSGTIGRQMQLPKDERQYLGIVATAQDSAEDANEIAVVQARKKRGADICGLLGPGLSVTEWTGVVDSVETTLGGDAGVLELAVADGVKIATWNNSISDVGDNSLIEEGSPAWKALGTLEEGDVVEFSGEFVGDQENCVRESSLMDVNGVLTPTFIFRFDDVHIAKQ
jgi:hypothetical protein